jgi:AcrR family transcriptional regulator
MKTKTARRSYRMTARAEAAAATGERILEAAEELFWSQPLDQIGLAEVAAGAGVSVQTVIRRYGSKEGVFEAAAQRSMGRVRDQRDQAPVGDVAGAVANLLDHYEDVGGRALRMLAEEDRSPAMARYTEEGRRMHRDWVRRTFAPQMAGRRGTERERRLAQLVAVCDVYTWKLLRRDAGLSRAQTQRALVELIDGLEKS